MTAPKPAGGMRRHVWKRTIAGSPHYRLFCWECNAILKGWWWWKRYAVTEGTGDVRWLRTRPPCETRGGQDNA